ncbi:DUF5667 domain-containing protein [Pseudonocardia sp. KRD291]|uniref:DUF5667 domain-containing protein n=1 Tax=Pseudonocardia sp. KRD291 TaxID=2792007 RepID=UPI001C49D8B7|nr:DUF5667 domain-containing protein [Pseudonocardia sp. KRD291]MBW0106833.1 hypothetical protein [Pseudonocardia sp. KRD291]
MPGAWHEDDRQRAEDGHEQVPPGASAAEELAHEIALAAALDRSRPSLSPDPQASARMRRRLVEAMAERDAMRPRTPAPDPSELTTPLGAPIRDVAPVGDTAPAASVGRAAGERTLSATGTGPDRRIRSRRARHVLPDDHPDQASAAGASASGGTAESRPSDGRPSARPSGRRRPSLRKRFGVVVTAVAALAVLAGVAATASRTALPGDSLYGVKRVTESTGGAFTFGDQAEAARQLELARTRVDEIERLMDRSTPPEPSTVTSAIDDFDTATSNGSRLMLSAERSAGGSQLGDLRTWATAQSGRMEQLRASMPQTIVPEADDSIALLERVLTRTEALRARTGCSGSGTDSVDDLGPLPSSGACVPDSGTARSEQQDTEEPGTDESGTGSPEPESPTESSGSSSPSPSTSGTSEQPGLGPILGGDPARSQSGEPSSPSSSSGSSGSGSSSSTKSTTDSPEPLLPPITLPPLLPGIGPVTIG